MVFCNASMALKQKLLLGIVFASLFLFGCAQPSLQPTLSPTPAATVFPSAVPSPTFAPAMTPSPSPTSTALISTPTPTYAVSLLEVYFVDVGQGDAILVRSGTEAMLVDCGDSAHASSLAYYLRSQGVSKLNYLVATHPHADHIGGCTTIMNSIPTEKVLDNGQSYSSSTYQAFIFAAKQRNYAVARKGFTATIGGAAFKILWPSEIFYTETNDNSVVLKLNAGSVDFLLTGDCEQTCEQNLLSQDVASEILKIGHHGSRTATSQSFLNAVKPSIAVISVGAGNTYGHPHSETLSKLSSVDVTVYRTDLHGTVKIRSDGLTYSVEATYGVPSPTPYARLRAN